LDLPGGRIFFFLGRALRQVESEPLALETNRRAMLDDSSGQPPSTLEVIKCLTEAPWEIRPSTTATLSAAYYSHVICILIF
jgi:hypothetical protein